VPALRFASGEPGTGTDALRAPLSAALGHKGGVSNGEPEEVLYIGCLL
jgi:hypothetical protein